MENTDKGRHLAAELREWVYQTKGWFSLRDVYRDLNVLSKEGQTAVRMALTRMTQAEPPVLEHHPSRNGDYRLIDTAMNVVSFLRTEDVVPYDVKLPFRLDEFCLTLKKNIIVIAGSPNSGKTGFLLNVVAMNQDKHDIHYFSSEMGAEEFAIRLGKFDLPLDAWNFKAYERSQNFPEAILPDALNIIDYYEVEDNFYSIGAELRKIHDRLRNGIAIIAIQKSPPQRGKNGQVFSTDLGRGGTFSLEKPRLYLSMDAGKLKVVKAKLHKVEGINPNGFEYEFKLAAGCRFVVTKWPIEILARADTRQEIVEEEPEFELEPIRNMFDPD